MLHNPTIDKVSDNAVSPELLEKYNHVALEQHEYKPILEEIIKDINSKFIERETLSRILVLANMSQENVYMTGVPGTGKTDIANCVSTMFEDGTFWQKTVDGNTKSEELYGDSALNYHDIDKRETVLGVNFLFLDEFPRANQTIKDGLLTVLNERYFQFKGETYPIPLVTTYAASNSLLTGEESKALTDRFPFIIIVNVIQKEDNFLQYIQGNFDESREIRTKLKIIDIKNAYVDMKIKVQVSIENTKIYSRLKDRLRNSKIAISDRKLKKVFQIMKVSAYLNNRTDLDSSDFFLMDDTCWVSLEDFKKIRIITYEEFFHNKDNIDDMFNKAEEKTKTIMGKLDNQFLHFLKYDFELSEINHALEFEFSNIRGAGLNGFKKYFGECIKDYKKIKTLRFKALRTKKEIQNNIFIDSDSKVDKTFSQETVNKYKREIKGIIKILRLIDNWKNENPDYYTFQQNIYKKLNIQKQE